MKVAIVTSFETYEMRVEMIRDYFLGKGNELIIEGGHQCLVGGDDVFACLNGCPDEFVGRVQTAHSFHHGIDGIVCQNAVKILGDLCIGKGNILQADDLGDLNILTVCGQIVYASAHNTEA